MISTETINIIINRLLPKFDIEKIILFGSQARADADERSDIDLLIISTVAEQKREIMIEMDRVLTGIPYGRDILVLQPAEFEIEKLIPGTASRYAFLEGKILYERTGRKYS